MAADPVPATRRRRRRSDALDPDEAKARRQARQNRRRKLARQDHRTAAVILAEELSDANRSRTLLRSQIVRLRAFARRQASQIALLRLQVTLHSRLRADLDVVSEHLRQVPPDAPVQGADGENVPVHQEV